MVQVLKDAWESERPREKSWLPPHPACVIQAECLNLSELQCLSCQMMPSRRMGPEVK